jgi:hypothetical protein
MLFILSIFICVLLNDHYLYSYQISHMRSSGFP